MKVTHGSHTQKVKKNFSGIAHDRAGTLEPKDATAPPMDMRIPPQITDSRLRTWVQLFSIEPLFSLRSETASQYANAARNRQSERFPTPPRRGRYSVRPIVTIAQPNRIPNTEVGLTCSLLPHFRLVRANWSDDPQPVGSECSGQRVRTGCSGTRLFRSNPTPAPRRRNSGRQGTSDETRLRHPPTRRLASTQRIR